MIPRTVSTLDSESSIREIPEHMARGRIEIGAALSEGFTQVTAEKVSRLLSVLRELQSLRLTVDRFTLKGGTALNIFHSRAVPRLSVDLDLMVTGFPDAAARTAEQDLVVKRVGDLAKGLGYRVTVVRSPDAATLECRYRNSLGSQDRIKIDLDILNRMTLLPSRTLAGPTLFQADDLRLPVVEEAELLGQKLVAVAYRHHPRDLYDMHVMLREGWHERPRARACYLAYSFLDDAEWHRLEYPTRLEVEYRPSLLADVLRGSESPPTLSEIREVARTKLGEHSPPFTAATSHEQTLRLALLGGDISAFADIAEENEPNRRLAIAKHPGLAWRLKQARTSH